MRNPRQALTGKFTPGRIIVRFKPHATEEERNKAHAEFGGRLIQQIPELNLQIVSVEPGKEGDCWCRYLHCESVDFAEPNYLMFPDCGPDDPFYHGYARTSAGTQSQWGLRRIGAERAWGIARLLPPTVKIAVIDSGIDTAHPDLAEKIVDAVNFSSDDPNDCKDESGHGTFVAGIAAAVTGNGEGIAGASFNAARIMPIKVGTVSYELIPILQAIVHAVKHGARILQMSFAGPEYSVSFQHAVEYAWKSGAVLVASAGNNANEQVRYPAGYCYVLGVSATNRADGLAYFSSWGISVGVAAPGIAILSTTPTYAVPNLIQGYDALSGTSYSSPFVSGVAALLLAANPVLTNAEVVQIIEKSARTIVPETAEPHAAEAPADLANEWSPYFGYGMLDAGHALRMALQSRLHEEGTGSFYGMVVHTSNGLPAGEAAITVRSGEERLRSYATKTNVMTTSRGLYADGMFRLMNIPVGRYDIYAHIDGMDAPKKVASAAIVPGADVFLRLEV